MHYKLIYKGKLILDTNESHFHSWYLSAAALSVTESLKYWCEPQYIGVVYVADVDGKQWQQVGDIDLATAW